MNELIMAKINFKRKNATGIAMIKSIAPPNKLDKFFIIVKFLNVCIPVNIDFNKR